MNTNDNAATAVSQCAAILAYLRQGYAITPIEALEMFGCFRLGARIWDLKRRGEDIVSERYTTASGKRVARYRMKP